VGPRAVPPEPGGDEAEKPRSRREVVGEERKGERAVNEGEE